ncbi:MAG: accessory gene regulator B family protein [Lachnospiraceae bacterium]|nr:accessory gene regulator B family protein [Lachnospiraceae bacterium]
MKQKISDAVAEKFIAEGVIEEADKEIYAYGWRALGMWLFCTATLFIIGIGMGEFLFTLIYFISYSIIRAYYDGYHANSRVVCYLTSSALFICCILFGKYVIPNANQLVLWMSLLILCICMNIIKVAEYMHIQIEEEDAPYEKKKLFAGIIIMLLMLLIFGVMKTVQFTTGSSAIYIAFMLAGVLFCIKRMVQKNNR